MIMIEVDTRNFSFKAFGETEAEARQALKLGWLEHCRQYPDADPTYVDPKEDGNVTDFAPGFCFRDDSVLIANGIPCIAPKKTEWKDDGTKFRVNVGERNRYFRTQEAAAAFCQSVFARTNTVLAIEKVKVKK